MLGYRGKTNVSSCVRVRIDDRAIEGKALGCADAIQAQLHCNANDPQCSAPATPSMVAMASRLEKRAVCRDLHRSRRAALLRLRKLARATKPCYKRKLVASK